MLRARQSLGHRISAIRPACTCVRSCVNISNAGLVCFARTVLCAQGKQHEATYLCVA